MNYFIGTQMDICETCKTSCLPVSEFLISNSDSFNSNGLASRR